MLTIKTTVYLISFVALCFTVAQCVPFLKTSSSGLLSDWAIGSNDDSYIRLQRQPDDEGEGETGESDIIYQLLHDRLMLVYLGVTFSILLAAFGATALHMHFAQPPLLVEEETSAAVPAIQTLPMANESYHCYTRIRFGGWSREFLVGQDSLMCEFIQQDKRRNRIIIPGPMLARMVRTPTYIQPDQKSLVVHTVWRRSDPVVIPPTSVRLRLENADASAGLYVYTVELFLPSLNCTSFYSVYTTLFGGTAERIDAIFKQNSVMQNTRITSPTYGLTYLEAGLFCYFYSCSSFMFANFVPAARTPAHIALIELVKQGFVVCSSVTASLTSHLSF
jgi:hypothetical protein